MSRLICAPFSETSNCETASMNYPEAGKSSKSAQFSKGNPTHREDFIFIDGLNVIRVNRDEPRLEWLLTLVADIASSGFDFGCVFDANTRHVLKESQGTRHMDAYLYLLREYSDFFVEVTGRTRADDLILAEADARSANVVSNDTFQDYKMQYPWVEKAERIYRLNAFRRFLHISGRRLLVHGDLEASVVEIENALAD